MVLFFYFEALDSTPYCSSCIFFMKTNKYFRKNHIFLLEINRDELDHACLLFRKADRMLPFVSFKFCIFNKDFFFLKEIFSAYLTILYNKKSADIYDYLFRKNKIKLSCTFVFMSSNKYLPEILWYSYENQLQDILQTFFEFWNINHVFFPFFFLTLKITKNIQIFAALK